MQTTIKKSRDNSRKSSIGLSGLRSRLDINWQFSRTRFAPAPTGFLHQGHVLSALVVWVLAKLQGASVILRIEDHDRQRCRPDYEKALIQDLLWLGLIPDEGLDRQGNIKPGYRQSDKQDRYLQILQTVQSYCYNCVCSRKTLLARVGSTKTGAELAYDGHCRHLQVQSDRAGLRIGLGVESVEFDDFEQGLQIQNPANQCGDLLLRDKVGNFTYHFAVVVDDWDQKVDQVIRGADLLESTGRQILLRKRLFSGSPSLNYLHHDLIMDPLTGRKLSKVDGSEAIGATRERGERPEGLIGSLAYRLGWCQEDVPISFKELVEKIKVQMQK